MGDSFTDGDTVASGSGSVFINGLPAARMGDATTGHNAGGCFFPPTTIAAGSGSVFVNGMPIARLGDPHAGHRGEQCDNPPFHTAVLASSSGSVFSG